MKLQLLPMGARFEYEGQVYVKTGPLTAASEKGGQRMIPRSAILRPLDSFPTDNKPSQRRQLDEITVLTAFEEYHATASGLADEAGLLELESARERFLRSLR